jgi:hypothetical protein
MLVKEHKTRNLPTLTGTMKLFRTWTMDEDIHTGKISNKKLVRVRIAFFLSLPIYIVGAYVLANWITDIIYIEYRIIKEDRMRRKIDNTTKN